MKAEQEKLEQVLVDSRLITIQRELINKWSKHLETFQKPEEILGRAYTIREFGLFIDKPFEDATKDDLERYLMHKVANKGSITGNRPKAIYLKSAKNYRF